MILIIKVGESIVKRLNTVIIILLSVVLIAFNGYSQDKPLKFGARLGTSVTLTNMDVVAQTPVGNVSLDKKPRLVLNFGAFGEYWFSKTSGEQKNNNTSNN